MKDEGRGKMDEKRAEANAAGGWRLEAKNG
jgi:hypothetical protein